MKLFNFLGIVLFAMGGFALFQYFTERDPLGFGDGCNPFATGNVCDNPQLGYLIAGLTLGFIGLLFTSMSWFGGRMLRREAAFRERARPGRGTVVTVEQPGNALVNNQPLLSFGIKVMPDSGAPYEVTHRTTVSPLMMSQVKVAPGVELPLLVDPDNPNNVRIDWDAALQESGEPSSAAS